MKSLLPYIIILALLLLLFNRECTRPGPATLLSDTLLITTTIPGDSIPYEVNIIKKVPVPVYVDTGSTRWRSLPVDTGAIFADYFARRYYDDTLMNDTNAFIRIKSHTSENRLFYDKLFFQNNRPTQVNTTMIMPRPEGNGSFYIGLGVNFLPGNPGVSGNVLITTKKKMALSGGYDITNKMAMAAGYYKISFKKRK